MKLTMIQFVAFSFMLGWVAAQAFQADYQSCLILGCFSAFMGGHLNDTYKALWATITKIVKR